MLSYSKYAITLLPILSFLIGYTVIQALKPDADITIEIIDSSEHVDNFQVEQNKENFKTRFLVLVSLLDGRVAALDHRGHQKWIVSTGNESLVSSSISNVVVTKNGVEARLIPSLDGALYQLDDNGGVEPFPLDAEALLSSSFRMSDDASIVGGKFSRRYGVNVDTGKLHYECGVEGCTTFSNANVDGILSIQRQTKTIRAIELTTGQERWNFSVSEHSITYNKAAKGASTGCQRGVSDIHLDTDTSDSSCSGAECHTESLDIDQIKVLVSKGVVYMMSDARSDHVLWEKKFNVPIANAWVLKGDSLLPLNLFDRNHLSLSNCNSNSCHSSAPLIYLGQHDNQIYVLPSEELKQEVKSVQSYAAMLHIHTPQLRWYPLSMNNKTEIPLIEYDVSEEEPEKQATTTLKASIKKPLDSGSYLYPEESNKCYANFRIAISSNIHKEKTLRNWWKEVMALSITMSVMLHMLIQKIIVYKEFFSSDGLASSSSSSTDTDDSKETDTTKSEDNLEKSTEASDKKPEEFVSRFCTDFDTQKCLGKGGFGVVFDVKNKMDDFSYAVKRISLKNSETAKSKVIREVKALAKLSHPGIVRYHQSWFESPPRGWLEEHDLTIKGRGLEGWTESVVTEGSTSTANTTTATSTTYNNNNNDDTTSLMCVRRTRKGTICADDSGCNSINHDCDASAVDWPELSWDDISSSYDNGVVDHSDSSSASSTSSSASSSTSSPFEAMPYHYNADSSDGIVFASGDSTSQPCTEIANPWPAQHRRTRSTPAAGEERKGRGGGDERLILYIQMQLCQTRSLKDWLCENTLSRDRDQIYDIFDQIVVAVDYVHRCGMMHRDLKPSNIFFSDDGSIKIGDFGLATTLEDVSQSEASDTDIAEAGPRRTRSKVYTDCVGTKLYMSPEQMKGANYTYKVDIYALGMIFFELFFPFNTEMERVSTLCNVKVGIMPDRFTAELAYECQFVKPLLSVCPDQRPDTQRIRDHELFSDFEAQRKLVSKLRIRTTTESSK